MQACHCGVASVAKNNSTQSSVATQQGQHLKLKYFNCFLKKNWGVGHNEVPERPFASEVECCHCTLCLIVPDIIHLDMLHTGICWQERWVRLHRDKLSDRGRSVGSKKGYFVYVLGQMTLAIELRRSVGHKTVRQATFGELVPEDKWHFLRTVL